MKAKRPSDGSGRHSSVLDAAIPMFTSAAMTSAFRLACHAGQQRECSQAWPIGSVPNGKSGSL